MEVFEGNFAVVFIAEVMRTRSSRLHGNSGTFSTMDTVRSAVTWTGDGGLLAEEMPALGVPGCIRRSHGEAAIETGLSFEAGIGPDAISPIASSDVVDVAGGRDDVEGLGPILERVALLQLLTADHEGLTAGIVNRHESVGRMVENAHHHVVVAAVEIDRLIRLIYPELKFLQLRRLWATWEPGVTPEIWFDMAILNASA